MKNNKTCSVCGHQQSEKINDCTQCGWDFPVMLGSAEEVKLEHTNRLKIARSDWRQKSNVSNEGGILEQSNIHIQEIGDNELRHNFFNKKNVVEFLVVPFLLSACFILFSLFLSEALNKNGFWALVLNPVAWMLLAVPVGISWKIIPMMNGRRIFEPYRRNLLNIILNYVYGMCYICVLIWYCMLGFVVAYELFSGEGSRTLLEPLALVNSIFIMYIFYKNIYGEFQLASLKLIIFIGFFALFLYFVDIAFLGMLDGVPLVFILQGFSGPLIVLLAVQELRWFCNKR